jgi:hypothetical protein
MMPREGSSGSTTIRAQRTVSRLPSHRSSKRPATRKASRKRTGKRADDDVKLPAWAIKMMEESLDRQMERWAKKLLLVSGGVVRNLTPEEIELMVYGKRGKPKPTDLARRRRRKTKTSSGRR